jgi:hypothetical protein
MPGESPPEVMMAIFFFGAMVTGAILTDVEVRFWEVTVAKFEYGFEEELAESERGLQPWILERLKRQARGV